jgi:hypothetical protein
MFLVAIAELGGSVDAAIGPLAPELNTTAYELRLLLNAGFPAVVLATVDEARAAAAKASIARLGHVAVSCDRGALVKSRDMTALVGFAFTPSGLIADERDGEELPFDDIGALLRGSQRSTTETTEEIKERKLRPVMAVATGGLIMSKKTTREVTHVTEEREQVLYLFRRSGAAPWILRERQARYGGLGKELGPASSGNFMTLLKRLRAAAPHAPYDERLMSGRPIRGVAEGGEATDLLAYLLAAYLMTARS